MNNITMQKSFQLVRPTFEIYKSKNGSKPNFQNGRMETMSIHQKSEGNDFSERQVNANPMHFLMKLSKQWSPENSLWAKQNEFCSK